MDERAGAGGAGCSGPGSCSCGSDTALLVDAFDASRIPGWVSGTVRTPAGVAPLVKTSLSRSDVIGSWKARWGIGRMNYRVTPGLYGVGAPDEDSPVLVSANYKMSFDRLRRALAGIDAWILVLDTKGINVWCAAGKGTFGTREIVERIARFRISDVVRHRMLILPQLGAPGVEAHEVKKQTGFRAVYGPVRADDLPAFIAAHGEATPAMRSVRFNLIDRLVLTPMELVAAIKPALILLACLFLVKLIGSPRDPFLTLLTGALRGFLPFLGAVVMGSIVAPALLPYVPVRAFAWKGWLLGLLWAVFFVFFASGPMRWEVGLFYLLVLPPISGYLAMNFTGASTYTSLSGVVREMKTALPALIVSAGLGMVSLIGGLITRAFLG